MGPELLLHRSALLELASDEGVGGGVAEVMTCLVCTTGSTPIIMLLTYQT